MSKLELFEDGKLIFSRGGAPVPDSPPNPGPILPPIHTTPVPLPPQPTPAGCEIRDVTWARGLNYLNAPLQNIAGPVAFKVPVSHFNNKSQGGTQYGVFEFYELGVEIEYCVASLPCHFPSPRALSPNSVIDIQYVSHTSPAPPSGYQQLPPPSADGYYYVNVRPLVPGNHSSFFLMFD